jgi:hypothetical protein
MQNIHPVIYSTINLHMTSGTPESLHPSVLHHIGKFTEYIWSRILEVEDTNKIYRTLHKIHTFAEAQQDGSKIKYLFRQSEMNTLLKDCQSGLEEASEVLKVCRTLNQGQYAC